MRFSPATIAFDRENQLKCLKCYRRKGKRTFKPLSSLFSAFSKFPIMTGRTFHRTMEMIPPPAPGSLKTFFVSNPIKRSTKQGNARGTSEVRRGTSSNHFHCPVPRSSSHIGFPDPFSVPDISCNVTTRDKWSSICFFFAVFSLSFFLLTSGFCAIS